MPFCMVDYDVERDFPQLSCFLTTGDCERLARCTTALHDGDAVAMTCRDSSARASGIAIAHLRDRAEFMWNDSDTLGFLGQEHSYLENIELEPAARGQGLGKRLLSSLEGMLLRRGKRFLALHTSNPQVFPFYEHCGYAFTKTSYPPWRSGKPTRIYEKTLDPSAHSR
jgi:GNAT superfamily N-acetyltransferase